MKYFIYVIVELVDIYVWIEYGVRKNYYYKRYILLIENNLKFIYLFKYICFFSWVFDNFLKE